jgi:uncharacterized protein YciI
MERKQYIYVLRPVPRLTNPDNWTQRDNDAAVRHFQMLQGLLEEGKLILAGRTQTMDESTFGIAILEVESEEEARTIMENDPMVKEQVATAQLFPYRVALSR